MDANIGERVASTYERVYPKKPTDNIFDSHALYHALGPEGFRASAPGGRLFELPLEMAINTTMQMVGEFSTLDLTRIPVFDAARFDIKIAAGTCVYSYLEMHMNQGSPEAKWDLIANRIENARKSHFNLINTQGWSTMPPGSDDFTSIPTIISTTPTVGIVGNINAGVFTWWRNRANSGQSSTQPGDNLNRAVELTHDQCSLGGYEMVPTFIISDLASYVLYQSVLQTRLRYYVEDLGKKGDTSFLASAIRFKNTPWVYDEQAPANSVYLLNNKVLFFEYLDGALAKLDPAVDPANMLMNAHKMYSMGNFTTCGRRHLGVVFNVS